MKLINLTLNGRITLALLCLLASSAASASRLGVAALPPYTPSASARSVSIVTSRTLRSLVRVTVKESARHHQSQVIPAHHDGRQVRGSWKPSRKKVLQP